MLDLLGQYAALCFAMVFVGFLTAKIFLYGSVTTVVLSVIYTLLPSFSGATVIETMWPRLIALWTIYPRLLDHMLSQGFAEFGLLGAVIYVVVALGPLIPYVSGIVSGLLFWPELVLLRVA